MVRAYVDDMHRYLAAADVVIGKAGPASVMEALAVGRPVLVTSSAGLNERRVVEFLQAHALGRYVPRPEQAVEAARPPPRPGWPGAVAPLRRDRLRNMTDGVAGTDHYACIADA